MEERELTNAEKLAKNQKAKRFADAEEVTLKPNIIQRFMRRLNDPDNYVYPYRKENVLSGKMVECNDKGALMHETIVSEITDSSVSSAFEALHGKISILEAQLEDERAVSQSLREEIAAMNADADTSKINPEDDVVLKMTVEGAHAGGESDSASQPGGEPPLEGEMLTNGIVSIIEMLDTDNETHFNKGGEPSVKAIEELLGQDITAEERDVAFDVFKSLSAA